MSQLLGWRLLRRNATLRLSELAEAPLPPWCFGMHSGGRQGRGRGRGFGTPPGDSASTSSAQRTADGENRRGRGRGHHPRPCRFYAEGHCREGSKCPFPHVRDQSASGSEAGRRASATGAGGNSGNRGGSSRGAVAGGGWGNRTPFAVFKSLCLKQDLRTSSEVRPFATRMLRE